jgi:hypothetical protein
MIALDPQQIEFYQSGDGTPYLAFMYAKKLSQRFLADIYVAIDNETAVGAGNDLVRDLGGQSMRNVQVFADLAAAIAAEFGLCRRKKLKFSVGPLPPYRCVVC